jgi:hypothetical protein
VTAWYFDYDWLIVSWLLMKWLVVSWLSIFAQPLSCALVAQALLR